MMIIFVCCALLVVVFGWILRKIAVPITVLLWLIGAGIVATLLLR